MAKEKDIYKAEATSDTECLQGYLEKLNHFSEGLESLSANENLEAYITKELRNLSSAFVVVLNIYDSTQKCLHISRVEAESWITNKASSILGMRLEKIESPVSDEIYDIMLNEQVGIKYSLTDASFGAVPLLTSKALGTLFNLDRYIGIAYFCDKRLYGTSLLAMQKGTPDPPLVVLRTFAYIAALALQSKQAKEALHTSEDKYRLLLETMCDGVMMVDNEDVIQFVNPALYRMFGYSESDLIGKSGHRMLIVEEDWKVVQDKNSSRTLGITDNYVVRGKKSDNSVIWTRISGAPVYNNSGNVIGSVGILSEITESIQTESALRQQNAYLDELIEGASEAIVILDNDDHVRRINKEFTRMFEYTSEEAIGQRINDLIVPDDMKEEGLKATSDVAVGNSISFETLRRTKTGILKNVSVLGNPVKQGSMQLGVYGIYRDITEKVRLEEQLRQSQRMESIGQLAGGVAHDFNNMLTVILGYGDQLLMSLDKADPHRKEVEEIVNAGNRAMNLTSQLLAFGRKQMVRPHLLNLNDIINDMSIMLSRLITEDIEFQTILAENLGNIKADISQMEQVILNLVVNACEAMPKGGKLIVQTSNYSVEHPEPLHNENVEPGEYVLLSVTDNGIGISPEIASRLFEPFFTTKGKEKGNGLGLSTVFGVVKQAGGYIGVESLPDKGSSFKVLIPRIGGVAYHKGSLPSKPVATGKGQQILVVDDDEMLRNLINKIINKLGYAVTVVSDGNEAIRKVETENFKPQLMITDMIMPGMNGMELAEKLVMINPGMKVLFMSGHTESKIFDTSGMGEEHHFIQKPFTRQEIADKIEQMMRQDSTSLSGNEEELL